MTNQLPGYTHDIFPWYGAIAEKLPHGAMCVELGVWCGASLYHLYQASKRMGKGLRLIGVDLYPEGYSFNGYDDAIANHGGLFAFALTWMVSEAKEMIPEVRLIRWESDKAARLFDDGSVDLVFIDAAHDYDHVIADIRAWWPKVKIGGYMGGHDFQHDEYPGVVKAVTEFFPEGVEHAGVCWGVRKVAP